MLCSSVSKPPGGMEALLVCLCIQPPQIVTFTVKAERYANATVSLVIYSSTLCILK